MAALEEKTEWSDGISQLKKDDTLTVDGQNAQMKQLANRTNWLKERLSYDEAAELRKAIASLALENEAMDMMPDGFDGMISEDFSKNMNEVDNSQFQVTSISQDKLHLELSGNGTIITGGMYQIGDHAHHETVFTKSVTKKRGGYSVELDSPLANSYTLSDTVFSRGNFSLRNGMAYGGPAWSTKTETLNSLPASEINVGNRPATSMNLMALNPNSFTLDNASIVNNRIAPSEITYQQKWYTKFNQDYYEAFNPPKQHNYQARYNTCQKNERYRYIVNCRYQCHAQWMMSIECRYDKNIKQNVRYCPYEYTTETTAVVPNGQKSTAPTIATQYNYVPGDDDNDPVDCRCMKTIGTIDKGYRECNKVNYDTQCRDACQTQCIYNCTTKCQRECGSQEHECNTVECKRR